MTVEHRNASSKLIRSQICIDYYALPVVRAPFRGKIYGLKKSFSSAYSSAVDTWWVAVGSGMQ